MYGAYCCQEGRRLAGSTSSSMDPTVWFTPCRADRIPSTLPTNSLLSHHTCTEYSVLCSVIYSQGAPAALHTVCPLKICKCTKKKNRVRVRSDNTTRKLSDGGATLKGNKYRTYHCVSPAPTDCLTFGWLSLPFIT